LADSAQTDEHWATKCATALWFRSWFSILIAGATIAILCALFSSDLNAEESDAALRAAEGRLLGRLWQMPFYLTTARPHRAEATAPSGYGQWREQIVATVFWVGESASLHNPVPNNTSAWDAAWQANFGGIDDPRRRTGFFPTSFCQNGIRSISRCRLMISSLIRCVRRWNA